MATATESMALDTIEKRNQEIERLNAELEKVKAAVNKYHLDLDLRVHGGVAAGNAIDSIRDALNMPWIQGEQLKKQAEV